MRKNVLLVPAIMLFVSVFMRGQEPPRPVSPEVQSDRHVTFRLAAPNASKVVVNIEGQHDPVPMQKDEHGIWSATAGPLPPDIYGYSLVADGVPLIDPSNQLMKPNLLSTQSAVHIPDPSLPWEIGDVA